MANGNEIVFPASVQIDEEKDVYSAVVAATAEKEKSDTYSEVPRIAGFNDADW